ncbi:MAG TPA: outer membrane protein assembly factor BamA [Xanthobacteraceae bacterium]|jgi:outer membrane protein insertion porin family
MDLCVRFVRGLSIASFVLGGIALSLAAAGLAADVAYAQTSNSATVNSIVVEGNRRVEASTVRSYFKVGPSGRLDAQVIDDAYKALYATGLFQDVRISQSGGRIVVTLVENPVINRIAFEGNKKVKEDQLKLEIQSKERGTLSRAVVQSDVQRLVEVYRRGGRFDVHIDPKIIELPNSRVDLVFEISEGAKTDVKLINFVGNHAYSGYRLKDEIKTVETGLLAFLQTGNIYDPDRIEADRELLRRFYLKHGYIDVRVVSAIGEFDPAQQGFIITFTIDEGEQYRIGTVEVRSKIPALSGRLLEPRLRMAPGDVYNAESIEKSVEDMTIEASRQGFAFASVKPGADRNSQGRTINLYFTVEEGQRTYIERINIRGNSKTRDYVVRREFDVAEGDAYNRALINRAERRLKNLNYFKNVKITTEPGSAPDRVVLNVDVEDQSTGEVSLSGGYSTSDGALAEASIGERNLFGLGLASKVSVTYGQHSKGATFSFVEPYLFGYRLAFGLDLYGKQQLPTNFISYQTDTLGAGMRLGVALREDLALQLRYSVYRQSIVLPSYLANCNNINPDYINTFPTPNPLPTTPPFTGAPGQINQNCYIDGEASLPVKVELANGATLTSLVGYSLIYNTVDDNRNPTSGMALAFNQDFAGAGGNVRFLRETADLRRYFEVIYDIVGVLHLQAGAIEGWGNGSVDGGQIGTSGVRMLDNFQMGPNLVHGFAPAGIGPRDLTFGTTNDALGGTRYWGASLEFQTPLFFIPKEMGIKVAAYVDAGSLWDYRGPTASPLTGETMIASSDSMFINSAAGVGLIWASPFGPLRFDLAYPITKRSFDKTQIFRFGGGASF